MSLRDNFLPFVKALERSIANENWYSALIVAATLPDICCSVDGTKSEKKSRDPYIAWFDKYIDKYKLESVDLTMLNGANAYALRCEILHDGAGEISDHKFDNTLGYTRVEFLIVEPKPFSFLGNEEMMTEFAGGISEGVLVLNPRVYCQFILNALGNWLDEYEGKGNVNNKSEELIKIKKD